MDNVQDFDLVTFTVAKHEQLFRKRVVLQCLFHQDGQPVDALAEVDNAPAQIHSGQCIRRPHHPRVAAVFSTVVNVAASTEPENATDTPFGK